MQACLDAGLKFPGINAEVTANRLANARQHTLRTASVRVGVRQENGSVVLEVADKGPGLFPEEAEVFERFYRADPSPNRNQGGTGRGPWRPVPGGVRPGHRARFLVELPPADGAAA